MLFSLRRKAPKDSPRRCLGLSSCYWQAHTHGSKVLQCSQRSHSPPLPVREATVTGKSAPAGAKLPIALAARSACSAVACTSLRVQTRVGSRRDALSVCTNGRTERSRLLFVLFLSTQEKNTFLLCKGERYVLFSAGRKDTKRAVEATASNSHPSAGKRIPTARKVLQCSQARTGHQYKLGSDLYPFKA